MLHEFIEKQRHVDPIDITALKGQLDCCGWVKLETLGCQLGWTRRKLQSVAHASKGAIISGQRGYKLFSQATPEEREHAANWLDSQASDMKERARAIRMRITALEIKDSMRAGGIFLQQPLPL